MTVITTFISALMIEQMAMDLAHAFAKVRARETFKETGERRWKTGCPHLSIEGHLENRWWIVSQSNEGVARRKVCDPGQVLSNLLKLFSICKRYMCVLRISSLLGHVIEISEAASHKVRRVGTLHENEHENEQYNTRPAKCGNSHFAAPPVTQIRDQMTSSAARPRHALPFPAKRRHCPCLTHPLIKNQGSCRWVCSWP